MNRKRPVPFASSASDQPPVVLPAADLDLVGGIPPVINPAHVNRPPVGKFSKPPMVAGTTTINLDADPATGFTTVQGLKPPAPPTSSANTPSP